MKHMALLLIGAIVLSGAFITGSAAASDDVRKINLQEAVSLALQNNQGLLAAKAALQGKKAAINVAGSNLRPKVSIEERFMRTNNPTYAFSSKLNQERFAMTDFAIDSLNKPEDINDFQSSISVEQPLYAKQASVGVKMARLDHESETQRFARHRETVVLQVMRAALNVMTAKQYGEAAEKALEEAQEHDRISLARAEAGLGLRSDGLRTTVSVKEAEERVLRARKQIRLATLSLGLVTGIDGPAEVTDINTDSVWDEELSLEEYLQRAQQRSDLKAMRMNVLNAENNVSFTTAAYHPVIGAGGSYQFNGHEAPLQHEGDSYQVMVFARWSFYDGGSRSSKTAQARAALEEARQYLYGLEREVRFKVQEAWLNLDEARQGLDLARARVELALESTRLIKTRYENSLATVSDLLNTQSALNGARAMVVEKENNYLLAMAELRYQSGIFLRNDNHEN